MSVRVRFSPRAARGGAESITIDDARTALASWLYARHEGGTFFLYADDLAALGVSAGDLRWLGLDWDGDPLVRSERLALYEPWARRLSRASLASGDASSSDLADVVDDHEMGITHVFLSPNLGHQAEAQSRMHETLGWTPPGFVYLPLIKAEPSDEPLAWFREEGYQALAVANQLARLGWSPLGKRALLSLPALAERFDFHRLSHNPLSFDWEQLDWFNRRCLAELDEAALVSLFYPRWRDAYGLDHRAEGTGLAPDEWQRALALSVQEEVSALRHVADKVRWAFVDRPERSAPAVQMLVAAYAPEVLSAFADAIAGVEPFDFCAIDVLVSDLRWRFKASHGIRSRDVMHVIRAALTGRLDGPCLVNACQVLGRRRCVERAMAILAEGRDA